MSDIQIVRAEDPRVGDFEAAGYRLVGESWGARLRLPEAPESTRQALASCDPQVSQWKSSGGATNETE
jgi:hypothetical protein